MMTDQSHSYRFVSLVVLAVVFVLLVVLAPDVLLIVFSGILFAVLFGAGGGWIAARTGLSRGKGIGVFALLVVVALAGIFAAFAPAITLQAEQLAQDIPTGLSNLKDRIEGYSWGARMIDTAEPAAIMSRESGLAAASAVSGVVGAFGYFGIMLFIGLYGAIQPDIYRKGVLSLLAPSLRPRADAVIDRATATLQSWLTGQLMSMATVGVLTWIGLTLIGVPLALLLALIAALLAFIPNIGPIIAAVPAVLLAIPEGNTTVLLVVGVYVVVEVVESYLVTPLIQQKQVSLPPALVVAVQVMMGILFGVIGLTLASPLTALAMTLVSALYIEGYLEQERAPDVSGTDGRADQQGAPASANSDTV